MVKMLNVYGSHVSDAGGDNEVSNKHDKVAAIAAKNRMACDGVVTCRIDDWNFMLEYITELETKIADLVSVTNVLINDDEFYPEDYNEALDKLTEYEQFTQQLPGAHPCMY